MAEDKAAQEKKAEAEVKKITEMLKKASATGKKTLKEIQAVDATIELINKEVE